MIKIGVSTAAPRTNYGHITPGRGDFGTRIFDYNAKVKIPCCISASTCYAYTTHAACGDFAAKL